MANIVWTEDVTKESIPLVGGKGANLGEMIKSKLPVPQAFILTSDAYWKFVSEGGIKEKIMDIIENLDPTNDKSLNDTSEQIRALFADTKIPWDMEIDILNAYKKLGVENDEEDLLVAVRSSATAEDLPEASFAGQQETYLNVKKEVELLKRVKDCWSSLFTPRAIFYRDKQGFAHDKVALAVVVQQMVNSEVSGVMFTSDPVTGEPTVVIEGGFGLGEAIVGGEIIPDTYHVAQQNLQILNKKISKQTWMYTKDKSGKTIKLDLEPELQKVQKLSNENIMKVAKFGIRIEEHYDQPMDVEWCLENNKIFIVQARPVTTIKKKKTTKPKKTEQQKKIEAKKIPQEVLTMGMPVEVEAEDSSSEPSEEAVMDIALETHEEGNGEILLRGLSASPGIGAGKVAMVLDINELDKVKQGDILVTTMTSPDMVPAMQRAAGIVTDEGGTTCHAAIVSRELGIPCIVGTEEATEVLSEGMGITVEANLGVVYEGIAENMTGSTAEAMDVVTGAGVSGTVSGAGAGGMGVPVIGTKVLINLGVPDAAEKHARLPVQGVGLMREEFIVGTYVKIHPNELIERGESEKFVDILADGMAQVARAFFPRPVVMRTSDFKTNEYRDLEGGEKFEPEEANPMIGWRGCSRYVTPEYEEAFKLELQAIKKIREEMGLTNLWVMLPFVRTVDEAKKILELMRAEGLESSNDFKIWIMAEVPSNIFLAEEFAKLVDGFSIGSNDLTQLVMGADRDSTILEKLGYFDERNEAVKRAISQLIKVAHKNNCLVSICGQAPSKYPEFTEFLVQHEIDSISVNPDKVMDTIHLIAHVEKKIIMKRLGELLEKKND
jgi:pyruvate,water dikinase